jgi:hypothetical protein
MEIEVIHKPTYPQIFSEDCKKQQNKAADHDMLGHSWTRNYF